MGNGVRNVRRVALILNPKAGGAPDAENIADVIAGDLNVRPSVYTGSPADAVKRAVQDRPDLLIAAGGDGTISAAAAAAACTGITLGVIPAGTLNHFAKDMKIPLDVADAVRVIAAGKTTMVDVAEVNGRRFINNSSLGLYPRVVLSRKSRQDLGQGKWVAFFWAVLAALQHLPSLDVRLTAGDAVVESRTPMIFIGNNEYIVEGVNAGTRERLDGACLFVSIANARSAAGLASLFLRAITKTLHGRSEFNAFCTPEVRIDTRRRHVHVSLDGEVVRMSAPLIYKAIPASLRVAVP